MAKYFGTDGFRGQANAGLNVEHAYKIGRFLGNYFGQDKTAEIVIGRDTRISGGMFEAALLAGITAVGGHGYSLGVTSTPCVAYVTKKERFDIGVMISASHNPYYDNGIKLFASNGHKIDEKLELLIEAYIDEKEDSIQNQTNERIGKTVQYPEGRQLYIESIVQIANLRLTGMKVGLDLANGSATTSAVEIFDRLGAEVHVIGNTPNGININEHCGSTHPKKLQDYVLEHKLDLGLAFDGDADRLIAVDGKGRIVDGDIILYICGNDMKQRNVLNDDVVVTTVMSNIGLYLALDRCGIKYEKTAVGDKYVHQCMEEHNYSIGGEQSGHIIFMENATTGDGVLSALMLLEAIKRSKKSLADLADEVDIYPQLLVNVRVTDKETILNSVALNEVISNVEDELGKEGRVLVRPSGTEPLIRVMVEAKTNDLCKKYVEMIVREMEA